MGSVPKYWGQVRLDEPLSGVSHITTYLCRITHRIASHRISVASHVCHITSRITSHLASHRISSHLATHHLVVVGLPSYRGKGLGLQVVASHLLVASHLISILDQVGPLLDLPGYKSKGAGSPVSDTVWILC